MTNKEIAHLYELGKLEFSEEELKELSFENLLNFFSQVKEANIKSEMIHTKVPLAKLRADEVRQSLSREEILKNAPKSNGEQFIVPQVVE